MGTARRTDSSFAAVYAAIDRLPMPSGEVRISVGHLVTSIRIDAMWAGVPIVRLSNSAHARGQVRYDALGGAVSLEAGCLSYLKGLGASGFKYDEREGVYDARFFVPDRGRAIRILKWFADLGNARAAGKLSFETSPVREVIDELAGTELCGIQPVAPRDDPRWHKLKYVYLGVAVQMPTDGGGTSVNEGDVPSRRVFHCWELVTRSNDRLYEDIVGAAPLIRILSKDDLQCVPKGTLADGTPVADNVNLPIIRV